MSNDFGPRNGHGKLSTSRRGFFTGSLGMSLALRKSEQSSFQIRNDPEVAPASNMGRYESILAQHYRLNLLGVPRTWSLVEQGFHPFAPDRIAILPSGDRLKYRGSHQGRSRSRVESRIAQFSAEFAAPNERGELPPEKLESIFLVMDLMTNHYQIPGSFEDWAVKLAEREILCSTGLGSHWGWVHQFQVTDARVDSPPVDWWLFLFPDGIDWESLCDREPVYALIGHVGRKPHGECAPLMLRVYSVTSEIMKIVDPRPLSRMSPVAAARHLNRIAAECLEAFPS